VAAGSSDLVFALIFNSVPGGVAGDALCDRIGMLLAQFPQVPSVATLAPLSPA
jgi:hypothetical protein